MIRERAFLEKEKNQNPKNLLPLTLVLFRAIPLIDIPLTRGNGGPRLGTRSLTGGATGSRPPTNTVPGGPARVIPDVAQPQVVAHENNSGLAAPGCP